MIELLRYLEANGFTTYIASGGDRDFMRPFADSSTASRRSGSSAAPSVSPDVDTDAPGCCTSRRSSSSTTGRPKPIRIWSRIGRRPLVAGRQLQRRHPDAPLRRSSNRATGCGLLMLHDDAEREFAYDQPAPRTALAARRRPGVDRRLDARRLDAHLRRR